MEEALFKAFPAWEPLLKARKAKGLDQWQRLSHLAEKLHGKQASQLAFTTSYPGQEGTKKYLGTVDGNQQFLLGYGNPRFHLAPYHWQIIDPSLSDEEAEKLHLTVGHPAKPELWENLKELEDEGDLDDGEPHSDLKPEYDQRKADARREAETITVRSGAGSYAAVPSEQMIYGLHNNHRYKWDLARNSYFAATNPELAEKMESGYAMDKSMAGFVGYETPGYEDVPADLVPMKRDIVQDETGYRVQVG